ncbi:MAG: hypothetical protein COB46_12815 [Rhodospirillaceae bacterium]|nr:MAG: hypothetical protein COB46_12815 [Rhodospirillaceae bacterium]
METFFKTLKAQVVWRTRFGTRLQAETSIKNYINNFYNIRRCHSALGNISPMRYENMAAQRVRCSLLFSGKSKERGQTGRGPD